MNTHRPRYLRHRFPPDIISHAVWLYHRYCMSFRDVEDLLAERGIIVSYETIRQWCGKFGPDYARQLKRRMRRECLDHVLFWNAGDLERKLADFQAYYNAARSHASWEGYTPLGFAGERTAARAEFNHVRWISHCRGMVQLPAAA